MSGDGTCMGFVGVSTGQSSIRRVFPEWARALALPSDVLVGHDLPPGAPAAEHRALIERLRDDPAHRGALVTTHKVSVYRAAADLFDELDPLARTFGEVSSIYRRGDRWCAAAKDPVTVRLALDDLLPADHFTTTGAEALCLGSGGSGMALSHQLGVRADRPAVVTCTALDEEALQHLRELHAAAGLPAQSFRYVLTPTPQEADALVAALPPASLVVNATGLGKDRPGSPLSDQVRFPERGVVWEFNYRGSLEFLRQAERQRSAAGLQLHDGWRYFIHGWTQVIADVFEVPMPPETVAELAEIAAAAIR